MNELKYRAWIRDNEPAPGQLLRYRADSKGFSYRPKISIIMPAYNPVAAWLKAAIESVEGQAYENWELCIADASTDEKIKALLRHYSEKDARIRVAFLGKNEGIAENSNQALRMAEGEYVGFLDHDDELSPDALYEVARLLQESPEADLIYSDEDKIDVNNRRHEPFFKPDWSPDLMLSCMYTCHLSVYRKSILDEIGGFRRGFEGSQDYDLALRFIERARSIRHIPRILYHWRTAQGSTSISIDSKRYAEEAAKKALCDYMSRNGIQGEVLSGLWPGSYHVKRALLNTPLVSVAIPARDSPVMLRRCIESIVGKTTYPSFEVLVVSNDSVDRRTRDYFRELKAVSRVRVLDYCGGPNFSAINNYAARYSRGDVLLFLDDDAEVVTSGWVDAMLEHAQRAEVGAVGCKLLYPDRTVQHAGMILGVGGGRAEARVACHSPQSSPHTYNGYMGRENLILNLSAVSASCMMIRRRAFEEAGGFNERLRVFSDVDLCLRLRQKGYLIVYTPYAVLCRHRPRKNKGVGQLKNEIAYMREKWGKVIDAGDPYYNPNLTVMRNDFSIRP